MQIIRSFIAKRFYLNFMFVKIRNFVKPDKNRTLGTSDGFYCFSLFVKLFNYSDKHLNYKRQNSILEVGCGDTFVTSCLFYFCGYKSIYAIDGFKYLNKEKTISALDKAIKLLREQSKIVLNFNPRVDDEVFERLYQVIPSGNDFEIMAKDLKNAVEDYFEGKISIIHYIAPYDLTSIFNEKFDFIFSQAVLEHVFPLESTLPFFKKNLANGGIMYHNVDFKSHGFSTLYNGHYLMDDKEFKKLSSPFVFRMINRMPPSYFDYYFGNNFELLCEQAVELSTNLEIEDIKVTLKNRKDLIISSKLWVVRGV
jgi:SAM-dependent methyltransferase